MRSRIAGEPVLELHGVSVRYRVPHEKARSLKELAIHRLLGHRTTTTDFWALRDVDLVVGRGESLGVVGHNGAGKSTLLKVVAAIIRPRVGRVQVRGRLAPLLELGTGLELELTGRENVFLNGLMLGFTRRDIAARLERIVEFSGIGPFIDAPLRTYSNGMLARLGFAIATDIEPDVLIIDEILGGGDLDFQQRSSERILGFQRRGGTLLVVSHNLAVIQAMCPRTAWIDHGRVKRIGPTAEVLAGYRGGS
jgi:lipopolysaccharide transport system ATP-binding protein